MQINNTFLNSDITNFNTSSILNKDNNGDDKSISLFSNMLNSISNQENSVNAMKEEYLNGERDDIDNILVEGQKLNLEINFALQVRNNLVSMMQTLLNMQI